MLLALRLRMRDAHGRRATSGVISGASSVGRCTASHRIGPALLRLPHLCGLPNTLSASSCVAAISCDRVYSPEPACAAHARAGASHDLPHAVSHTALALYLRACAAELTGEVKVVLSTPEPVAQLRCILLIHPACVAIAPLAGVSQKVGLGSGERQVQRRRLACMECVRACMCGQLRWRDRVGRELLLTCAQVPACHAPAVATTAAAG